MFPAPFRTKESIALPCRSLLAHGFTFFVDVYFSLLNPVDSSVHMYVCMVYLFISCEQTEFFKGILNHNFYALFLLSELIAQPDSSRELL